jgi:hypothetical protein
MNLSWKFQVIVTLARVEKCTIFGGTLYPNLLFLQGCGSGSGLDPDSETLWIRIRIGNLDPGARKLRNFSGKNALFSYF